MTPKEKYTQFQNEFSLICPNRPIKLIAVSKRQPDELVRTSLQAGIRIFGENTIQEGVSKFDLFKREFPELSESIELHHLGPVQSGSLRKLFGNFQFTHGVGTESALTELVKRSKKESSRLGYFLQVNTTSEPQKNGFSIDRSIEILKNLEEYQTPQLYCEGLMTMGPTNEDPDQTRDCFSKLRNLRDSYFEKGKLSMGMSGDYKIAIEEGADLVRIGSAIFGQR